MGPITDPVFLQRVAGRLAGQVNDARDLAARAVPADHRALAHAVLALVVAGVGDPAVRPPVDRADLVRDALVLARRLEGLVGPSGLFRGGDNVASPPDSAFSVNDLADALHLLRREGTPSVDDGSAAVQEALSRLLDGATPALLAGGVHTPNHRWELCAALARLHRLTPRPDLLARIEEWLAEGLDQDGDGLWSERSANYAAYVSDPSLLTVAAVLDRPALERAVERNLDATLGLLLPDGTVETVLSRRQDQRGSVGLRAFLLPLRRIAVATGRGDLAWAAGLALEQGLDDAVAAATAVTLDPAVAQPLPVPVPAPATRTAVFGGAHLVVAHRPGVTAVVFGGSDHGRQGRIRSGLANSPTFLRLFGGAAVLDSVRLSRAFFGLGPFRADGLTVLDDGRLRLSESVEAGYHLPLPAAERAPDGDYALEDEGRFSAAMSFARRPSQRVRLCTRVLVRLVPGGAELALELDGPPVDWSLELAFRSGGVLTGAGPVDASRWELPAARVGAVARYTCDGDAVEVSLVEASDGAGGPLAPADGPPFYEPGEEYAYLGGTDAVAGERLYVTGRTPSRVVLAVVARVGGLPGAAPSGAARSLPR